MQIKLILLGMLVAILPQLREEADEAIEPENENLEKASDASLAAVADLISRYANDGKISKEEKASFIADNREALQEGWNALGSFGLEKLEEMLQK